ncbi:MAG: beta-lactamase family protein [Acidobacteriota bacterium]|nr:beta-lactamase family protein [Acidobacteriota bacterium]
MKSAEISTYLQERIDAGDFPSAVYLVAERGEIVFQDALGFAVVEPEKIEANLDTIYDLASLTKPLVTGLLCAKLIEKGKLNLKDKIIRFFILFNRENKSEIAIENLLTHTSGFSAWKPFYLMNDTRLRSVILALIADQSLENTLQTRVTYSDLNFILLRFLIEDLYGGRRFEEIAEKEIFEPLNLRNTSYNPPKDLQKRIAASERGNEYEKQTCIERGFDVSKYNWREHQIWGEVHDGNCYFMNGVSGHAGLFSNVFETFKIARQFLAEETVLLKPKTCKLFRANFTKGLNEARSIAFQLAETKDSTASNALSKDSFGHLGFTGTSLWIEPETKRIFILLTNRTHNRKLPFANINAVRRRFHELAAQFLNEKN